MSLGDDAGQMLLEAQVGFTGESLRVRPDRLEKTVYFLLDLIFANLMLPSGLGDA
jgi:hypothetical protein